MCQGYWCYRTKSPPDGVRATGVTAKSPPDGVRAVRATGVTELSHRLMGCQGYWCYRTKSPPDAVRATGVTELSHRLMVPGLLVTVTC